MISIRRRLLVGMAGAIVVVVASTLAYVYRETRAQIDALLDAHLAQIARSVPAPGSRLAYGTPFAELPDTPDLLIQVWDRDGARLYVSSARWRLPASARLGFADVETGDGRVRVYSEVRDGLLVQAAQPIAIRRAIAAGTALRQLTPLGVLAAALLALAWIIVGRGLAPLQAIRVALAARDRNSLEPIDRAGLPAELDPLVAEINALLARLDSVLRQQQAFVADAAHELRTPLTALRLQVGALARDQPEGAPDRTLDRLREGIARMSGLVEQLLALARQEYGGAASEDFTRLDLAEAARRVVARHADLATRRNIDLGVIGEIGTSSGIRGQQAALDTMIENLVTNALRHGPAGSRVDLAVADQGGRPTLVVDDAGPGIPHDARERVFDRFYRLPGGAGHGSGLGLAIVREIARRHDATVTLGDSPLGGLRVTLSFPPAPTDAGAAGLDHASGARQAPLAALRRP